MSLRHRWAVGLLGSLVALVGLEVAAQVPGVPGAKGAKPQVPQGKQPAAKPEPVTLKGSLEGAASGFLKVTSGNDVVYLQVTANSKLRAVGTAQLDYLSPGMLVQFPALVDKQHLKVKDRIDKLTIVTAAPPEFAPGALSDPGVPGDGDFKAYIICGAITSLKGDALTLNVPGLSPKFRVELAENPTIDVNIGDLSKANPGDGIEVRGMKTVNGPNTIVQVQEGKITLTQPLVGAQKKKAPPAKTPKTTRKAKPSE